MSISLFVHNYHPSANHLFLLLRGRIDIQAQPRRIQIQLVLPTTLLQDLRNLPGILDLPQLDVALALLDCLSDKLGGTGLTLGTNNKRLFLLASFVNQESGTLGFLLGDLFSFDRGGEFGGECKVL